MLSWVFNPDKKKDKTQHSGMLTLTHGAELCPSLAGTGDHWAGIGLRSGGSTITWNAPCFLSPEPCGCSEHPCPRDAPAWGSPSTSLELQCPGWSSPASPRSAGGAPQGLVPVPAPGTSGFGHFRRNSASLHSEVHMSFFLPSFWGFHWEERTVKFI